MDASSGAAQVNSDLFVETANGATGSLEYPGHAQTRGMLAESMYTYDDLAGAIINHQIDVLYNPVRSVLGADIAGYNASLHWASSEYGVIPHSELMRAMLAAGLEPALCCVAFAQICHEMGAFEDRFVRVTMDGAIFSNPATRHMFETILLDAGFSLSRLHLTVHGTLSNSAESLCRKLRQGGVQVGYLALFDDVSTDVPFDLSLFDSLSFWAPACIAKGWRPDQALYLRKALAEGKLTMLMGVDSQNSLEFARLNGFDLYDGQLAGASCSAASTYMHARADLSIWR